MFAVVDVETTGGHASGHRMTEIAIVLYDGVKVVDRYQSLLNPQQPIPQSIQVLTGITPEMVEEAPLFEEVAQEIREFLGDAIFVAHNVNFDYAFVRSALAACGMDYNPKRLCSVRYARKVAKGLRSYSLSNLCKHFKIANEAAHRAWGDAEATVQLMDILLKKDTSGQWQYLIKKNSGEFNLPANLPSEDYQALPEKPGVYYFYDQAGKPIYIGKARNLRKRVASHFISEKETKRSQAFKREIYNISFEETGSELLASLLEDHEIRHYWPAYNRAQKRPKRRFAVYAFYNQKGVASLAVNKITNQQGYLREFYSHHEATGWVYDQVLKYRLNPRRCGLPEATLDEEISEEAHNAQVEQLIIDLRQESLSCLIKTPGRHAEEDGFAYVQDGQLAGMGFIPRNMDLQPSEGFRDYLRELRSSITTQGILNKVLEERRLEVMSL